MDCAVFLQVLLTALLWKFTHSGRSDPYEAQESEYKTSYDAYSNLKEIFKEFHNKNFSCICFHLIFNFYYCIYLPSLFILKYIDKSTRQILSLFSQETHPPHPFHFGYDVLDEHGNKLQRQEQGDQHGNVKGSYGYVDAHGVYRQVDYVADHSGFRAVVQSNEPGVANEDPADVKLTAKSPPAHVLEQQYTKVEHAYAEPKLYLKAASKPIYRDASY
ncbi:UNVERIFIED_CONTAM: Cuticle protein 10.9 [Trichonephila clavipes]